MNQQGVEEEVKKLARKIGFVPDVVVGIVRGGVEPARLLAQELHVKKVISLTVKKVGHTRSVTSDLVEHLDGIKALLVEDMLETGKSMMAAKRYLETKGAVVKTACLYTMPHSEIIPDYFLSQKQTVVDFPWE